MTNEEKIQEIDRQIERVINRQAERIADYSRQIAEDYCNFFHWHAGDMYEAQMVREYFGNIKGLTAGVEIEEVAKRLDRMIRFSARRGVLSAICPSMLRFLRLSTPNSGRN